MFVGVEAGVFEGFGEVAAAGDFDEFEFRAGLVERQGDHGAEETFEERSAQLPVCDAESTTHSIFLFEATAGEGVPWPV